MKSNGEVLQCYNCQAVVDGDHQVIVAVGVSNQPPDPEHLEAMLERTIANTGGPPTTFIADAGYWSEENANTCAAALEKVNGEWTLWGTTHNLLKLFRFQTGQVAMATG